jgi:hypothetical protein
MADYLKLYGPATANLAITIGCYFHLKSKIAAIHPDVKLDDVHARLDHIEKNLNQIIPVLQQHDKILRDLVQRNHPGPGVSDEAEGEVELSTEVPSSEVKDVPAKGRAKAPPKAKVPPKAKAPPKAKSPKAKKKESLQEPENDIPEDLEDTDIEDQLDAILDEDIEQQEIELEATEATTAEPPPKAKRTSPKKSFKKN